MTAPDTRAALMRAQALLRARRADEACRVLSTAVEGAPDDAAVLTEMANAVQQRARPGDAAAALDLVNRTVALDPDAERPHRIAAVILGNAGLRRDAVVAASEALRRAPRSTSCQLQLASTLANGNWLIEAAEVAEALVAERPDWAPALRTLALIRIRQLRPDVADELIRRAIALEPENEEALRLAGMAATMRGDRAVGAARLVESQRLDLGSDRASRALRMTNGNLLTVAPWVRFLLHGLLLAAVAAPTSLVGRLIGAAIAGTIVLSIEAFQRYRIRADPERHAARRLARATRRRGLRRPHRLTQFSIVALVVAMLTVLIGSLALRSFAGYFAALQVFLALASFQAEVQMANGGKRPPKRNRNAIGRPPLEERMPAGGYVIRSAVSLRRIGGLGKRA